MQVIEENEKLSLNQWLEYYHNGTFQKISLTNDEELKGFELKKTGKETFFTKEYETETYKTYETKKSASLNLIDLGVALT